MKQRMETATQALQLETHPEGDRKLAEDVKKWTGVARQAADTLFGIAADRVNQMGGPGNGDWRAVLGGGGRESWGWRDEEEKRRGSDDEGERDEEEEEEEREREREKAETWGMGVMLKSLGISEGMLGWDQENECWKEMDEMEKQ